MEIQRCNEIESKLSHPIYSETLTELFCETLLWERPNTDKPIEIYTGAPLQKTVVLKPIAKVGNFPIFMINWFNNTLPNLTTRRAIHRTLSKNYVEHLLCFVTADSHKASFVWGQQKGDNKTEIRSLSYECGIPARTTIERLEKLGYSLDDYNNPEAFQITRIIEKFENAFNVEAVTEQFFEDYCFVFNELQKILYKQTRDLKWAHDYALQFLNRLMFIYFIQKKRFSDDTYWLGNNPQFISKFWNFYKESRQPVDTFYEKWLSILFFEAFNNKYQLRHRHFPEEINSALSNAPFLNGGLFTENNLDTENEVIIPDEFFSLLFDRFNGRAPGFLERYNFTITESTPFDIEVAVDPEMIGKVYESLVNITTEGVAEEDRRGTAGIFYTPRVEIDLMCKLSLVDYLANHLGEKYKNLLYDFVFAYEYDEKEQIDEEIKNKNLWAQLNNLLCSATVCDPACGSGSFLVGMLLVLDNLQERANRQLGIEESSYERRKRIIGEQLYGVDVMGWAVHVAELRLWLQLTVETKVNKNKARFYPLLPNLSFKIRCGDSLIQEIGQINFGRHRLNTGISSEIKRRINKLKKDKLDYFHGNSQSKDKKKEEIEREEYLLFHDIILEQEKRIRQKLYEIGKGLNRTGVDLFGNKVHELAKQTLIQLEEEKAQYTAEDEKLSGLLNALNEIIQEKNGLQKKGHKSPPFGWDIAFVEIFEDEKDGFDIVIGNPPYVRQEKIAPPHESPENYGGENSERWKELKQKYKEKLRQSVYEAYPEYFNYNPSKNKRELRDLNAKSDLYVYFYFHGLSLLNDRGSFCFITSNSWLDVDYGKDLQEFLIKCSHVKMILDNEKERSFSQADVNTVIVLLAPPDDWFSANPDYLSRDVKTKIARFVSFKKPFKEVLSSDTFKIIESATHRISVNNFRVNALSHGDLLKAGLTCEEENDSYHSGKEFVQKITYEGDKWGGKYLRAPEIYWKILEKGDRYKFIEFNNEKIIVEDVTENIEP